jgi:PelA/Pel-15E family pectate lyase
MFLMDIPHPTPAEADAINAAGTWLIKVAIKDHAFRPTPAGRALVVATGAPLIWARYYQIGTDKPLFGDRDRSIHDTVEEISTERRNGYAWYGTAPREAVQRYTDSRKAHAPAS